MASAIRGEEAAGFLDKTAKKLEFRRETLSEWLETSGADSSGTFRQLLLGQSDPAANAYRDLGLVHLMSASGIHLLAISLWIGFLSGVLLRWLRFPVPLTLTAKRSITGFLWAWCWVLCGARPGMLRPLFLLAFRNLARRLGFRWKPGAALLIAVALDFAVGAAFSASRNESVLAAWADPGRWFYIFALGGFLFLKEQARRSWLELTLGSWILTACFQLLSQPLVSLATVILSGLTIPWLTGVVYPLLVLRSGIEVNVAPALQLSTEALQKLAELSLHAQSVWWVPRTSVLLGLVLGSALWLIPRRWRFPVGGSFALLCAFGGISWIRATPSPPGFADRVEQLDVGQGDAALVLERADSGIESTPLAGMIDTGSAKRISEAQWLQFFSKEGVLRLHWVGLTHLDEDHAGGILRISSVLPIDCASTSLAELDSPRGKRWRASLETRGIRVTSEFSQCVPYPTLPPARSFGKHSANENMSAFFVPLRGGGFYLSAGDATETAEPRIGAWAEKLGKELAPGPRLLKISHHGSKSSTNPIFLDELQPTEAWISDGVGNHYGHPSPMVLERIARKRIPLRRTDQEGTLEF